MQTGCREYNQLDIGQNDDDLGDDDRIPTALKVSDLETHHQRSEPLSDFLDRTPFFSRPSSEDEPLKLPEKLQKENASASPRPPSRVDRDIGLTQYRNYASAPAVATKNLRPDSLLERKVLGLERSRKKIQFEMDEPKATMQKMNDSRRRSGSPIGGDDLDIQRINYEIEKAVEEKSSAENLCRRLKDRLATIEGKLIEESDSRRSLEMENKKQKSDVQSKTDKIEELRSDLQNMESKLEKEISSRKAAEDKNRERNRECQNLSKELDDVSKDHSDAITKLEMSESMLRETQMEVETLRHENIQTKNELSRLQSFIGDQKQSSDEHVNELRLKLDKKCEELMAVEKSLFQLQLRHENEVFKKNSIEEKMEKKGKEDLKSIMKLEGEIRQLQDQFKISKTEHQEKMNVVKVGLSDAENEIRHLAQKLKASQMERAEISESAKNVKNGLDEAQKMVKKLKDELREEKMLTNTLESELEVAKERMKIFNEDNEKLTDELDILKNEIENRDQAAEDNRKATDSYIEKLNGDFATEKDELLAEKRCRDSMIKKLQSELKEKEIDIESKTKELAQRIQQLDSANGDLKTEKTEKFALDAELKRLQRENAELCDNVKSQSSKLHLICKEKEESDVQTNYLKSELESSKELCKEMTQRVQRKDRDLESMRIENNKIKSSFDELKKTKLEMEADLREERVRSNGVREDLDDANKNRDSLQMLLSNVKGDNSALEEQLASEKLSKSHCEKEIEEQKALLELEMKSRSKIGVKVMEMEKQIETLRRSAEEEKRKCQVATDQNEMLEQRSIQHNQEVSALRNKIKLYQRKMKDSELEESRLPAIRAEFDVERQSMSAGMTSLRRQLDQLSEQLSNERNMRSVEEKKNRQHLEEITELKTNEKVQTYELEQSKRTCIELEEELQRQRDYYETSYCPIEELEDFKKSLEKKVRLDLQNKLQDTNMALEEESLTRILLNNRDRASKSDYLSTFNQLKSDINNVKATLNDQASRTDMEKYKELFEKERLSSRKLEEKLLDTNQRLKYERNRTNNLLNEGKAKVTKELFEESFSKIMNETSSPRIRGGKSWSTPVIGSRKMVTVPEPLSSIKRPNCLI